MKADKMVFVRFLFGELQNHNDHCCSELIIYISDRRTITDDKIVNVTFLTWPLLVPTNAMVWFPVDATATEVTSSSDHVIAAALETGSVPLIGWLMPCSPQ